MRLAGGEPAWRGEQQAGNLDRHRTGKRRFTNERTNGGNDRRSPFRSRGGAGRGCSSHDGTSVALTMDRDRDQEQDPDERHHSDCYWPARLSAVHVDGRPWMRRRLANGRARLERETWRDETGVVLLRNVEIGDKGALETRRLSHTSNGRTRRRPFQTPGNTPPTTSTRLRCPLGRRCDATPPAARGVCQFS